MDKSDMLELVRTLQRFTPTAKLDALIVDHTADASGRCPCCHTLGCTLYTAAMSARYINRPVR